MKRRDEQATQIEPDTASKIIEEIECRFYLMLEKHSLNPIEIANSVLSHNFIENNGSKVANLFLNEVRVVFFLTIPHLLFTLGTLLCLLEALVINDNETY